MGDVKVQPKENQGAIGAGFEGRTSSNSYSALPRSSNAGLGIDPDVAAGKGNAISNTNYGSQINVGGSEGMSSRKNLGYDEPWASGTVGSTENQGGYGPASQGISKNERGQFGESVLAGSRSEGSTDATLGSGSRAKGTAGNESGTPGRSGSMAFAMKGLSATPGSGPSFKPQPRGPLAGSMNDAEGGVSRKGNAHSAGK